MLHRVHSLCLKLQIKYTILESHHINEFISVNMKLGSEFIFLSDISLNLGVGIHLEGTDSAGLFI